MDVRSFSFLVGPVSFTTISSTSAVYALTYLPPRLSVPYDPAVFFIPEPALLPFSNSTVPVIHSQILLVIKAIML